MKRALAMALGAMLVAGAVPASAKSQIDFSGYYRTYMYGHFNQTITDKDADDYSTDFYFRNRLQLDFAFNATDEISVIWRLRAPAGTRWGYQDASGSSGITTHFAYGQIKQDWGTVSIGKLKPAFSDLGLASLGWAPSGPDVDATAMLPFDFDTAFAGAHYLNRWDNGFQLAAAFLRPEASAYYAAGYVPSNATRLNDKTHDFAVLEPAFLWDGGGASLGIQYERDQVTNGTENPAIVLYGVNPAVSHSFGDFSIHAEGRMAWGKWQEDYTSEDEGKASGYAAYFDVDYNYGPGNVNLAGWWAAGPGEEPDPTAKPDYKGAVGMGGGFAPLIVAYNGNNWNYQAANVINQANERTGLTLAPTGADANHMVLDLNGAHAFTDDLTLTYALAYLTLNKTGKNIDGSARDKEIGWEADLGLQIQLLDNLHFGTTFGYLMAGDALKERTPDAKSPSDAYNWLNTLTFNF
jgi:hypothetical protein